MNDEELAVANQDGAEAEGELSDDEKFFAKLKDTVVVDQEPIGSLRRKLTITVPRETVDERLGEQLNELRRDALIPGFRKGHAPIRLVEKRFAADVGDQLKSQLVSRGFMAAVEKLELKPLGDPLIWVQMDEERTNEQGGSRKVKADRLVKLDIALEHLTLPKEGPLTFTCEVELKPEFELPSLDRIPVRKPIISIDEDDVEHELKRMRVFRGTFKPIEEEEIEADDLLYVDMKMIVDGDVHLDEQNCDLAARDVRIRGIPLTGLGDALIGRKRDDVVTFEADVPQDHENPDIRGKKARFEFTIREVKRLEVPPIDAEFLSQAGFDSEAELRESVHASLESQLDERMKGLLRDQVGNYLVEKTTLDIPEGLSQRQTERSVARRVIEMYRQGIPEPEIEKIVDKMRASAHEQAVRDLKLYFILEKIAEEREIEVSEEEVNAAIAEMAARTRRRFDRVRDDLSKGDGMLALYLTLRDQRTIDALLESAEITEEEGPRKRPAKKSLPETAPSERPAPAKSEKPAPAARSAKAAPAVKSEKPVPAARSKTPPPKPSVRKPSEAKSDRAGSTKPAASKTAAAKSSPKKSSGKKGG